MMARSSSRAYPLGAVLLAGLATPSAAGELRGRVLLEGRAVPATVSAIPWESPRQAAHREARRGPAPAAVASVTTRPDGTFDARPRPGDEGGVPARRRRGHQRPGA